MVEQENIKAKKPRVKSADMVGKVYGDLKVLAIDHIDERYICYMLCECLACGKRKVIRGTKIHSEVTRSCGCLVSRKLRQRVEVISPAEYSWIQKRYEDGETQTSIAEDYGVTRQCIQYILRKIRSE